MLHSPGTRLLLVEDNPGDARLLRELLDEQRSYITTLTDVTSIGEAEASLDRFQFDIIILDLGLPDATGLEVVKRARAAAPHTPLVVLTGTDDDGLAERALQEGAQDYLIKGEIDSRMLLRAIRYGIERKRLEEALFEQQQRALVTLDCIVDAVVCTDLLGNVSFLNQAAASMTGWTLSEALGQPVDSIVHIQDATTRERIANPMKGIAAPSWPAKLPPYSVVMARSGGVTTVEETLASLRDRGGDPTGAVTVFRDVGIARTMSLQMAYTAQHDFLTKLPNRMLLNDRISHAIAIARRRQSKVAVVFLDLDGFKHINDSLGHAIGDKLLQSIAHRLTDCVRAADTVSRQGGDEFVVLLSEVCDVDSILITVRRIVEAVAKPHTIGNRELHVTTSVGVSIYPCDGIDAETLLKNADTAMYQAKENGRQNYRFFEPAMNVRAVERQWLEESLRRALERSEFTLHYQPKVNLRSGAISGAEALIRWNHPTRGMISPAQFIPIAEDCGIIRDIGVWVLFQACTQAKTWAALGFPSMTMAVNVSALEFRDENFLSSVFDTLEKTGMDPGSLDLELTESVLMNRAELTAPILEALRNRGVQVSVDDFGTGYSSLSYLQKFPLDALKIDQSFVRQINLPGGNSAIVTAIIAMARNLGLRVVAEGVETEDQLAFLQSHQCDEAQGYYLGRPMPPNEFAKLLALLHLTVLPQSGLTQKADRPTQLG